MRLAIVQTSPVFGEASANVKAALNLMSSVEADLYVLPELFNTGYNFLDGREAEALSEPMDGPTFVSLAEFAREYGRYVVYGFAERGPNLYNSAALVGPSGLVGRYRKVHLFDRENLVFAPGDLGFPVFDTPVGRIGMMICFDWMYPESARTLALKGTQIIAHPANLVMPHCPDALVTRCLENRVFAATANRVGREDRGGHDLRFIGDSEVVSPRGEILVRLGDSDAGVAVSEIEPALSDDKRINDHNDLLRGRRTDCYEL
ncbi:MAG: acyltransferase [Armatimonadetes bacterium]|nr:acyltransferase [Armatimonadota bacterium]